MELKDKYEAQKQYNGHIPAKLYSNAIGKWTTK